jgi:hypothetical protein
MKGVGALPTRTAMKGVTSGRHPGASPPPRPAAARLLAVGRPLVDATGVSQRWSAGRRTGCADVVTRISRSRSLDAFEFEAVFPAGLNGTGAAAGAAAAVLFPAFTQTRELGFVEVWQNMLSGPVRSAPTQRARQFAGGTSGGPLVLYNSTSATEGSGLLAAAVLAPLSNFKAVFVAPPGDSAAVAVGVHGKVLSIPAGFTQRVALLTRRGISAAYAAYGDVVAAAHPFTKLTLQDDVLNRRLSYWTECVQRFFTTAALHAPTNCSAVRPSRFNERLLERSNGAYYGCGVVGCAGPAAHGPMHKVLAELKAYHESIGLGGILYHMDPYWSSQHVDGHEDGPFQANFSASPFHFPLPGGLQGADTAGMDFMLLFKEIAGPDCLSAAGCGKGGRQWRPACARPCCVGTGADGKGGSCPASCCNSTNTQVNAYNGTYPMVVSSDGAGMTVKTSANAAFWETLLSHHVKVSGLKAMVWEVSGPRLQPATLDPRYCL